MADRGDTHYRIPKLNLWFAFSSILFLVATFWMVIDDWSRPWKQYQREFRAIEVERAKEALTDETALAAIADEQRFSAQLAEAQADLERRSAELDAATGELRQLESDQYSTTEAEKEAKQHYNWERYLYEEAELHGHEPDAETLREKENALFTASRAKQLADDAVAAKQEEIAQLRAHVANAEVHLKEATKGIDLVRKKLDTLAPADMPTKVANVIRDFPGLDFIGPQNKVDKVVLSDLTFELNFTKKPRIDMCMTCHQAIDRGGFEEYEQPFRSHPRLDLFLTAKSPHPLNEVGCTICHRGSGEALDFLRADHRASNEQEAEEWNEKYHWHKLHYWDYPMLGSGFVEASCVQCHKDSMELIAPEAPKVSEGYQLFERYGCYACHKVEWFPTKRRPGPTLAAIRQKTTKEFVDSWITHPKAFRPTTWMPQFFHLENYGPDVTVVTSEYGQGREMKGDEWSDTAIAAVAAFIWDRSADTTAAPIPVEGDALRGREVFRLSGCLACHNLAPHTEEERADVSDPAQTLRDTNEHGPNLRGVATKVTPEWLFAWIKDPQAYWSETRMPNLRLSDQDAADVVAYITEDPDGYFTDVPEGWAAEPASFERDVLEEQARSFYSRVGQVKLEERLDGEWADDQELLLAVGQKWVEGYGCHSCHEIPGLEGAQPIGTELTNWASKTVDKLDFGFMPQILAEQNGWSYAQRLEFKEYRENFLVQKLHAPRSYDRRKVKNPAERLKMPWFDFTDDEVQKLATFVVGLVDDEVQKARMVPSSLKASMDQGLRVIRQKNCAGCHVIEPGQIDFDDDGGHHSIEAQLLTIEDEVLPPPYAGFQEYVARYVDWMRAEDDEYELEEVALQLMGYEPGFGPTGQTIVVEDVASIAATPPWGGAFVDVVTDYYLNPFGYDEETDEEYSLTGDPEGEGRIEDVDGEWRSFSEEPYAKVRWTYAPPVLLDEGTKLQRDWFFNFLLDPVTLRPQLRVKMPTFNWAEGEAGAVADYFAGQAMLVWPSRYARRLLVERDMTPADVEADIVERGLARLSAAQVQAMADDDRAAIAANFDRLKAYGDAIGFEMAPAVDPSYEPIPQRSPSVVSELMGDDGRFFSDVHGLVVNGPNCVQCHFLGGSQPNAEGPIAWAPDLDHTRDRLRPDWVREWLTDPSKIYPGTAMPANFPADQSVWQDLLPLPSPDQIESVVDWLFNLDRAPVDN